MRLMKKALLLFGSIGGLVIPIVFTLLGWTLRELVPEDPGALASLHDVQLPLWPMSKLILDDPSGKHWLYLPLAALLSNALLYAAIGALSAWGRAHRVAFVAANAAAMAVIFAAQRGFGTSLTGTLLAMSFAVIGLVLHHCTV